MIIFQEKIAPPPAPLSDEEQTASLVKELVHADHWVDSFIARLTDTIRDMKH